MRNILTKIALAATLGLAITFTLGCPNTGNGDEPSSSSADNPSSSSGTAPSSSGTKPSSSSGIAPSSSSGIAPSSSSGTPPSSSSPLPLSSSQAQAIVPVHGDPITDSRDGKTYETVVIGTQTWMAKDLDYEAEGSKCYQDNSVNCMICGGRLYNRETAMTACPAGWHVPSDFEWVVLEDFIGGDIDAVWKKLRATNSLGTDDYGFSASINLINGCGDWWSATEGYCRSTAGSPNCKSNTHYLRCLKGDSYLPPSTPSYNPVSCVNVPGRFCDDRDGTSYKSVTIDGKTWMAENLAFNAEGSVCLGEGEGSLCMFFDGTLTSNLCPASEDIQANCATYGKLYDWSTAMAFEPACNKANCSSYIAEKHKGICPAGWHIPSNAEWTELVTFASGTSTAGYMLKAASGWTGIAGNGIDQYGFSALPGGHGSYYDHYVYYGNSAAWFASTEYNREKAHYRDMSGGGSSIGSNLTNSIDGLKRDFRSLRCVKD